MMLVLFLVGIVVFDLLALRLGARSWHDNRGSTWW